MAYLRLNEFQMNYHVIEQAMPRDTLLVHGFVGSNRWWEKLLESWQGREGKFSGRLVLAEWRGCGKSVLPEDSNQFDLDILASDYVQLLEELNMQPINLVSHSFGALIALKMMALVPQGIEKAVLIDPFPVNGMKFDHELKSYLGEMKKSREACLTHFPAVFQASTIGDSRWTVMLAEDAFQSHPRLWEDVLSLTESFKEGDFGVDSLQQPTLVVYGEDDSFVDVPSMKELARQLPQGKVREMPNTGHSPHVEHPEELAAILEEFLS